jgi:hypothetical protein
MQITIVLAGLEDIPASAGKGEVVVPVGSPSLIWETPIATG